MLLSQDRILSAYDHYMNGVINSKFSEYDKDKESYLNSINSLNAEITKLNKKIQEQSKEFEGKINVLCYR